MQRSGDEQGAIADECPGNFNCITDARNQCVILEKAFRAQTNFEPGLLTLYPNVKIAVGQQSCLSDGTLQDYGGAPCLGLNERDDKKNQCEREGMP